MGVDHRLHLDLAVGAGEEAAHLAEGEGSDAFEPADSAAECCCAAGGGE